MAELDPTSPVSPSTPPAGQAETGAAAPLVDAAEKTPEVNLQEFEDFKKYQRQVNETMRQKEAAYNAQIADLQNRVVAYEESGLDDFEKAQRHIQRLQQQIAYAHQQEQLRLQAAQEQQTILGDMQRIARNTGIPVQELFKCATLEEAEAKGVAFLKKSLLESKDDDAKKQKAHLPDSGGSGRSGVSSSLLAKIKSANTTRDIGALYMQALGEETE